MTQPDRKSKSSARSTAVWLELATAVLYNEERQLGEKLEVSHQHKMTIFWRNESANCPDLITTIACMYPVISMYNYYMSTTKQSHVGVELFT